jgi:peptidyl-prolyl cis-trans isomerase C
MSAAAAANVGSPSTVVASRGGASVTLNDVDAFAAKIPLAQRPGFFNSPARIQNAIDNLLLQKQLAAEARAAGLDKDPIVALQVEQAGTETLAAAQMRRYRENLKLPDFKPLAKEEFIAHKEKYAKAGEKAPTFDDVKDRIIRELRDAYIEKQVRTHSDERRNQPLDANPDLVGSLRTRYAAGAADVSGEPEPAK